MNNFTQKLKSSIYCFMCCFKNLKQHFESRWHLGVIILFLFGASTGFAQSVPLESNEVAGFGVDADIEADVLTFSLLSGNGTDDWFDYDNLNGGRAIIGVPTVAELSALMSGDNVAVRVDMAENPFFIDSNFRTWIDALYARDQRTNGKFKDATVFGSASDKNIHNPLVWTIKEGDVPQKNDIIDVYLHLRRAAPFNDGVFTGQEFAFTGASTRSQDGTSYIDFEYFRKKLQLGGNGIEYVDPAHGQEGGHTAFMFDNTGLPTQLGDIIMSVNYTNGGNVADIRIFIWMDLNGVTDQTLDTMNGLANLPFLFGDNGGGQSYYGNGTQAGTYGYVQVQPKPDPQNPNIPSLWAQVNADSAVPGTPWPTIDRGGDISEDMMYPAFGLAEIAINSTAFGFDTSLFTTGECESPFGSVLVKTRSSDSFTAELKDLVGPFDFGDTPEIEVEVTSSCIEGDKILTASLVNPGIETTYSWFKNGEFTGLLGIHL